jgi:carboxyl-terminal processing protease
MRKLPDILSKFNGWTVLLVILTFVLGWQLGHRDYQLAFDNYKPNFKVVNQTPPSGDVTIDFALFWQTWDLISEKYIDKTQLDPQKLYYGAIQGMVAAIGDPYTVFLPPQAQKSTKEQLSGEFDGVGMQLGYSKDKRLVVIAPLKDTPADKAGVKAGDLILKIDDKDANSMSLPDAVNLIRGNKGSSVKISLLSEGSDKPRDIVLVRDTITVKSVAIENKTTKSSPSTTQANGGTTTPGDDNTKTTKSGKSVAYIRLTSFGEKTKDEWDQAVSEALSKAPQGIIVDVRNNPGGFLDDAVYIASEFLDGGTIVIQQDYLGHKVVQNTVKSGKLLKLPLIVLINKGSASASEILAGAMQDRKRGQLVGEQSFGKGTIQSAEDLPQGTGIHITTAKWLTPNERWIHNIGLTPDIKVEMGTDPSVDTQLNKALEILDTAN